MKNNTILTIFKKELARFFKDKRTLIALLLPGILLYVIYSLMGGAMTNAFAPDDEYVPVIYAVDLPDSVKMIGELGGLKIDNVVSEKIDEYKSAISDGEGDLLLVFTEDFDESVFMGTAIPNVEIYYNSSSTNSAMAYQTMVALLDTYESSMANKFDINSGDGVYDLATE